MFKPGSAVRAVRTSLAVCMHSYNSKTSVWGGVRVVEELYDGIAVSGDGGLINKLGTFSCQNVSPVQLRLYRVHRPDAPPPPTSFA